MILAPGSDSVGRDILVHVAGEPAAHSAWGEGDGKVIGGGQGWTR